MINASLGAHYDGSFVWQSMMLWWQTLLGIKHQESADELQQKLSNTFGGKVVLTYKGRDAIELALRGYGLTSNKDVVLTQAFTCFAIEEAIVRAGAKPVYVDLAKDQLNFNVKSLQAAGKKHGKNVKAVIVQHGLGHPAEIDKIREWCNRQGVLVIEDLAQSFGAAGAGKPLGSFGDAVILSFGRDKVIDAVTGGAVVAQDARTACQLLVVADQQPAVAVGSEVLGGVEGEGARVPQGSQAPVAVAAAEGLGGVLDHAQIVTPREREERVHLRGVAEQMHGEQGPRVRGEALLDARRIQVVGVALDVGEDAVIALCLQTRDGLFEMAFVIHVPGPWARMPRRLAAP